MIVLGQRCGTDPAPVHTYAPPHHHHRQVDDDEDQSVDAEADDEEDVDPGDKEEGARDAEPDREPVVADVHVLVAHDHLGKWNHKQKSGEHKQDTSQDHN